MIWRILVVRLHWIIPLFVELDQRQWLIVTRLSLANASVFLTGTWSAIGNRVQYTWQWSRENGRPSFLFLCHVLLVCHLISYSWSLSWRWIFLSWSESIHHIKDWRFVLFFCQLRVKCNVGLLFYKSLF